MDPDIIFLSTLKYIFSWRVILAPFDKGHAKVTTSSEMKPNRSYSWWKDDCHLINLIFDKNVISDINFEHC